MAQLNDTQVNGNLHVTEDVQIGDMSVTEKLDELNTNIEENIRNLTSLENSLNTNLEWKIAGTAIGTSFIAIPTEAKELLITAYVGGSNFSIYQTFIITEQLSTNADVFVLGGYIYNTVDFGYASVNISETKVQLRKYVYATNDYTSDASLKVRYR